MNSYEENEMRKLGAKVQRSAQNLSCLGGRLGGVLSLAIHISPNNGAINMIQSDKLVVNVLTMH